MADERQTGRVSLEIPLVEWDWGHLTDLQKVILRRPEFPPDLDAVVDEVRQDPSLARYALDGGTLLHVAAEAGHAPLIRTLIDAGADVNAWSDQGTPLHAAGGNTEVLGILLEHGADPNVKDCYGRNPLAWRLLYHEFEAVKFLLAHGSEPSDEYSRDGLRRLRESNLL